MTNGTLAGVIVQFGGQTPLKLAQALEDAGIPSRHLARCHRSGRGPRAFAALVTKLKLKQPANGIARSREGHRGRQPDRLSVLMPLLRARRTGDGIVDGQAQLEGEYITTAVQVSGDSPVLIDQYLRDAIEVDVDAICDGDDVVVAGVLQHIEEAGVHSGDSACSLPPYSLPADVIAEIERQTDVLARALKVRGLMDIQFAVKASGRGRLKNSKYT